LCEEVQGNSNWSIRAGIAFSFIVTSDNGFPVPSETERLNQLEDDIFNIFQKNNNSIITIVVTTSGFREYMMYTNNKSIFNQDFQLMLEKYPEYHLTTYFEEDKEWLAFKSFQ
jgi:hypothetical protein